MIDRSFVVTPRREPERAGEVPVRVWDLPVRIFHWLIAALFAFSWWSAENDRLDWHFLSGYVILTLVLFRVYWGFVGSKSARFGTFLKGPRTVAAYGRRLFDRTGPKSAGHNPMGGWNVAVLLALLLVQTVLGLFAIDVDGLNAGPLDRLVSFETGRLLAGWHGLIFDTLLFFVGLHLAAIGFYAVVKRENLVAAMLTGVKRLPQATLPDGFGPKAAWRAIPGLVIAALIVAAIVFGRY